MKSANSCSAAEMGMPLLGTLGLLGRGMLGLVLVLVMAAAGAACKAQGPLSLSGTLRSAVVSTRLAVPVAKLAYMTDVLLLLWPSPRTWPSSCITAVSKSYCPAPTCVGSAPAYQLQPWIMVTWSASSVQPSTPWATPPSELVVFMVRITLASVGSVTSRMVTPYGAMTASMAVTASWMRASSSLVRSPLLLSTYRSASPPSRAPAVEVPTEPSVTSPAALPPAVSWIVLVCVVPSANVSTIW